MYLPHISWASHRELSTISKFTSFGRVDVSNFSLRNAVSLHHRRKLLWPHRFSNFRKRTKAHRQPDVIGLAWCQILRAKAPRFCLKSPCPLNWRGHNMCIFKCVQCTLYTFYVNVWTHTNWFDMKCWSPDVTEPVQRVIWSSVNCQVNMKWYEWYECIHYTMDPRRFTSFSFFFHVCELGPCRLSKFESILYTNMATLVHIAATTTYRYMP